MTLRIAADGAVALVGDCRSEDAETLLRRLSLNGTAEVDWRECESAHTAVVQVMIAAGIRPRGPPASRFLAEMVEPRLMRR